MNASLQTVSFPDSDQGAAQALAEADAAQRAAADPCVCAWVGASAGSGKTKVLADRVTRLLLANVRPEKILCLTFTRAAAAEMSLRLTQNLSRWAVCPEEELTRALRTLLAREESAEERRRARTLFATVLSCPGGLRLMTLHAFAQEVLRRFPLEAGLPPTFRVIEEAEARSLWDKAQNDLLHEIEREKESAPAQAFARLVGTLGEESLTTLLRAISKQAEKIRQEAHCAGGVDVLMRTMRTHLDLGPQDTPELFDHATIRLNKAQEEALLAAGQAIMTGKNSSPTYLARARTLLAWLAMKEGERLTALPLYARLFFKEDGEPYKELANKALLRKDPAIETVLRNEQTRLIRWKERRETCEIAQKTEAALTLSLRLATLYEKRKATRGALDFDDLIERTNALFSRADAAAWVLYKLDGGIDHLLLDEAQDTSPAQWRIIEALTNEFFAGVGARGRGRTVFVVGDEKQSIYSFQGADVEVFSLMRERLRTKVTAAATPFHEAPLNVSFRSAPAVLHTVDRVFSSPYARAGVADQGMLHRAAFAQAQGRVELWPLFSLPKEEKKEGRGQKEALDWGLPIGYKEAPDPGAQWSAALAKRVKAWIKEGQTVYDRTQGAERPMHYGDIMILVQRRGTFVPQLVRALKAENVPVSGVDRMRLMRQMAVMDIVALLNALALERDDLTLATVLRGPLIALDEDALMTLAIGREDQSLWTRLNVFADKAPKGPFGTARDYMALWLTRAQTLSPFALVLGLLNAPCPACAVSGRAALESRLGIQAEDPLDELLNAVETFCATEPPSLQGFLRWLATNDVDIKREMEGTGDYVRVITVHGAKGLESPVVILPDAAYLPDKGKIPPWLWAEGLPFYVSKTPRNGVLRALREEARAKQLEEYRRLFYVAMTRAAQRLYIGGHLGKKASGKASVNGPEESWYALIAQALQAPEPEKSGETFAPRVVFEDPPPLGLTQKLNISTTEAKVSCPPLPSWAFREPLVDVVPTALTPSHLDDVDEDPSPIASPQEGRFLRGRAIHRLLERLPALAPERRQEAAALFLQRSEWTFSEQEKNQIAQEVLRLFDDPRFAPLFSPESRAEVPIVGFWDGQTVSGQIDRLVLTHEEVWIVDYKTNRPPPEDKRDIPLAYKRQMEAYRAVLRGVYPTRTTRCFLLWTYAPRMMEI